MRHEFTAVHERDADWVVASCPEVPGANGQGRTKPEPRESLAAAIALILEDRREDGLRGVPAEAERETVTVEVPDLRNPTCCWSALARNRRRSRKRLAGQRRVGPLRVVRAAERIEGALLAVRGGVRGTARVGSPRGA